MRLFNHRLASWELPPEHLDIKLTEVEAAVRKCNEVGLLAARKIYGPAICALDDPNSEHALPLSDLCWLMRSVGHVDIDWRDVLGMGHACLLYTSPSPRDRQKSRMPSSA